MDLRLVLLRREYASERNIIRRCLENRSHNIISAHYTLTSRGWLVGGWTLSVTRSDTKYFYLLADQKGTVETGGQSKHKINERTKNQSFEETMVIEEEAESADPFANQWIRQWDNAALGRVLCLVCFSVWVRLYQQQSKHNSLGDARIIILRPSKAKSSQEEDYNHFIDIIWGRGSGVDEDARWRWMGN